jgi:hypothetical protein
VVRLLELLGVVGFAAVTGSIGCSHTTESSSSKPPADGARETPLTTAPVSLGPHRWQQTVTVGERSEAAIQRALDGLHGPAIVVLPAGRYVLAGTIEIKTDDLLLIGQSPGSLALGSAPDAGATILEHAADEGERAMLSAKGRKRVHVSGIRFAGVGAPASASKGIGVLFEDVEDFRVDHSYFEHLGFAGVRTNGTSSGVIDHSAFFDVFKQAIGTDGYGVAVYGTNRLQEVPLGVSAQRPQEEAYSGATFIEDNQFSGCRHSATSNKGGRFVFRHNHVTSGVVAHAVDAHGTEYGSSVGGEWMDVYDNQIDQPFHEKPYYDGWAVRIRGGKGLIHDNKFSGYRFGVELSQLTDEATGPVYVWGNTLSTGGPMVKLEAKGPTPTFAETPVNGYTPHAYPHPRVAASCGKGKPERFGWALVCKE